MLANLEISVHFEKFGIAHRNLQIYKVNSDPMTGAT